MKTLLMAVLLTVSIPQANAELITEWQSHSFGTLDSYVGNQFGWEGLNQTLTIDAFDPYKGHLHSVAVTIRGQINGNGSVTNESDCEAYASVQLNLLDTWSVNDHDFAKAGILYQADTGGHSLAAGDKWDYSYSSGQVLHSLNMSPELFLENVDFNYSANVSTQFYNAANSGTSTFINRSSLASWGEVSVGYTYIAVPTPWTLLIFGLVLLAVCGLLKRTKSN